MKTNHIEQCRMRPYSSFNTRIKYHHKNYQTKNLFPLFFFLKYEYIINLKTLQL